ncbi:disks large homolog 1-like isoform X2 [Saccoglossus kowalevskii]
MPVRKQDAHRALELLEDYHSKLTKPGDRPLRAAIERVIRIFKSRLFQALLDIQEFYEVTLLDGNKSIAQKTFETLEIASKWEQETQMSLPSPYRYHDDELPPPPELGPDTTPRLVPVLGSNVDRKVENVQTYVQQSRVSPPRAAPAPVRLHADQVKETSSPEDQYPSPPPLVSTAPRPIPVPIPTPPSPPLLAASSPQPPPFVNGVGEDDWEYEEITLKRVSKYVYLNRLSYSIHVLDQVCL